MIEFVRLETEYEEMVNKSIEFAHKLGCKVLRVTSEGELLCFEPDNSEFCGHYILYNQKMLKLSCELKEMYDEYIESLKKL